MAYIEYCTSWLKNTHTSLAHLKTDHILGLTNFKRWSSHTMIYPLTTLQLIEKLTAKKITRKLSTVWILRKTRLRRYLKPNNSHETLNS